MTYKFAVFVNPIEHSLSPIIHSFFAQDLGLDVIYDKIKVEDNFKDICSNFLSTAQGCNVTVPFKQDAFLLANNVSQRAQKAKACNTLKKQADGSLYGDNTDGAGLVLDLIDLGLQLKQKNILVIGAGGAVRGILDELYQEQVASISVYNRTLEKAQALVDDFAYIKVVTADSMQDHYDVIINASSSSLYNSLPNIDDSLYAKANFVYDLMYTPIGATIFTQKAQALGCPNCYDGLGMLIGQAAFAFKLWTDKMPNISATKAYMRQYLQELQH